MCCCGGCGGTVMRSTRSWRIPDLRSKISLTTASLFVPISFSSRIAETIGETIPTNLEVSMVQSRGGLETLWDRSTGEFYSRDRTSAALVRESSVATLMPLYSGSISRECALVLIKVMEDSYLSTTRYPLPSVPPNSSWFEPKRYWQGPTWLNINWFVIDGLKRYGFNDHAEALTNVTIELAQRSGFREYFDPLTGEGAGSIDSPGRRRSRSISSQVTGDSPHTNILSTWAFLLQSAVMSCYGEQLRWCPPTALRRGRRRPGGLGDPAL